ncbi:MAG TPA: hypothetical protein PKN95_10515 [Verrucomicrobiota bacterium]|nr:hypothetical protein [Verrucomicrobiota bacterium]HNT14773.1 hypothetical protein [Verrucomicrobiota bacterium]
MKSNSSQSGLQVTAMRCLSLPFTFTTLLIAALSLALPSLADNIAAKGHGIIGIKLGIDSAPGKSMYSGGIPPNINDENPYSRVDTFSAQWDSKLEDCSFVGVLWPTKRYEDIGTLTLTMACFGDGGWFGANGVMPPPGTPFPPAMLAEPTVQVTTNGGVTWTPVAATSDYTNIMINHYPGGQGGTFNPNTVDITFTLTTPASAVNGVRLIGTHGGTADKNGFLGVWELGVDATFTDSDFDGMPDAWELAHGLLVGTDDSLADHDLDGLNNYDEYLHGTNPDEPDTDGDGYSDAIEVAEGSNPTDPGSVPGDLARFGTATLGTQSSGGVDTEYFHVGIQEDVTDGNFYTVVDNWNGDRPTLADPKSYVGIIWWSDSPTNPVQRVELALAAYVDGGWFGPNGIGPAPGQPLQPAHLVSPAVEVSQDYGATWTAAPATSDYLTLMKGHQVGGNGVPNPHFAPVSTFVLDPPATNINAIRIIGSEGGGASGGFLAVSDLKVFARTDVDEDGMDDDWERRHGLIVGVKDDQGDPDLDGLKNLSEFQLLTDPHDPDTDDDGLNDGDEVNVHFTNPLSSDTDTDGLSDGEEINIYGTNPLNADSDDDGFNDGLEVSLESHPLDPASTPDNFALRNDASGLLGVANNTSDPGTPIFNAGSARNIHDGDVATRVDNYSNLPQPLGYVGIAWTAPVTNLLTRLRLDQATFFDGGWFGVSGVGPGAGGVLSAPTYLGTEPPTVQVTTDGVTWTTIGVTSDYLTALEGHALPAIAFGPPTRATANFVFNTPQAGLTGVRIIGAEGGTADNGFIGVFELAALTSRPSLPVTLLNAGTDSGNFRFEFDTQTGGIYEVQYRTSLTSGSWQTLTTINGDGTRKAVTDAITGETRFYRVESK